MVKRILTSLFRNMVIYEDAPLAKRIAREYEAKESSETATMHPTTSISIAGDIVGTRNAEVDRVEETAEQARRRNAEAAIIAQLSAKYDTQKAAAAIVLDWP